MEEDREATNLGPSDDIQQEPAVEAKKPKRRFVGRKAGDAPAARADGSSSIEENGANNGAVQVHEPRRSARTLNRIPESIVQDDDINAAIALLPPNYNFEIHKTIHRIRQSESKNVALQFPEGLLLFATTISDILERFCEGIQTVIMGDVTYGACCIDDYTARALGCDLLIHYAHSCLIPMSVTQINTLYVFVSIGIDTQHLINTLERNFESGKTIAMVGTIQFNAAIHTIVPECRRVGLEVVVPQIQPLSKGEILGCTSPRMPTSISIAAALNGNANKLSNRKQQVAPDALLYVGDGRFHLESAMIHNPSLPAYRYDPYSRRLTREHYSHTDLHQLRTNAIFLARSARRWGLILGSLGRQGNPHTLTLIERHLERKAIAVVKLSLSEIMPGKLALMEGGGDAGDGGVEAWVQVACPRLSIDWGYAFGRPLLSPYEALVALGVRDAEWMVGANGPGVGRDMEGREQVYPMDYYEKSGLGRVTAEDVEAIG